MITGELKNQFDQIWDVFWSGGISNPMDAIEQMTYLLFLKRLDDLHLAREKAASRLKREIDKPIFKASAKGAGGQQCRWSKFKHLAPAEMYKVVAESAFPFMKSLGAEGSV